MQLLPGNGRQEGMGKREEHLLEVSFLCTQLCASGGWWVTGWAVGNRNTLFKLPMEYLMVENIHCSPTSVCVGSVAQKLELWLPCPLHVWVAVVAVLGTSSFQRAAAAPRECKVCSAGCACVKQRAFPAVLAPGCGSAVKVYMHVCTYVLNRAFVQDSFSY